MAIESRFVFSDAKVARLPVVDKRYEVSDVGQKGLRLRVMPSGSKIFVWYYRDLGGKRRVLTLGTFDSQTFNIDVARAELTKAKKRLAKGDDLRRKKTDIPSTVGELAEDFYAEYVIPQRLHAAPVRQVLDRYILPTIGNIKINEDLTAPKLNRPTKAAVEAGAAVLAGKVLAITKQMFGYAVEQGYIVFSPARGLKAKNLGVQSSKRRRELSDVEIAHFWGALEDNKSMGASIKFGLRLLLLTGLRTNEVRLAQWRYVDWSEKTYTVPVEHQKSRHKVKNPQPFIVPLSSLAIAQLEALRQVNGDSDYVLCSPKKNNDPITEKAMNRAVLRLYEGHDFGPQGNWVVHDFRRTLRSFLPKHGCLPVIAEKCLNHSLGGVASIYDVYDYLKERREALNLWGEHIENIIHLER